MTVEAENKAGESISLREAREKADYEQPLSDWLKQRLPGCEHIEITNASSPEATGSSSELLLLDIIWQDKHSSYEDNYVVRLEPKQNVLLPDVDFRMQFDIQKAVGNKGTVPMANMREFEPSSDIFGSPFYVMDRVAGLPASDVPPYNSAGWLAEGTPQLREHAWWTSIRAMAELHRIDVDNETFGPFRKADTVRGELESEIAYYERLYDWARGDKRYSLVEEGWAWIKANLPDDEPCCLCWGDARMGNMLYSEQTGECTAMLDWEMFSFGAPEKDIAYWNWSDRFLTEGFQVPRLPGWPSYEETVIKYETMSGSPLKNMAFYDVFAALRNLTIYVRVTSLYEQLGKTHAQMPSVEDVYTTHWLDQLLHAQ